MSWLCQIPIVIARLYEKICGVECYRYLVTCRCTFLDLFFGGLQSQRLYRSLTTQFIQFLFDLFDQCRVGVVNKFFYVCGVCYLCAILHRDAIDVLQQGVNNNPENILLRLDLAIAVGNAGDFNPATEILNSILEDNPSNQQATELLEQVKAAQAAQ